MVGRVVPALVRIPNSVPCSCWSTACTRRLQQAAFLCQVYYVEESADVVDEAMWVRVRVLKTAKRGSLYKNWLLTPYCTIRCVRSRETEVGFAQVVKLVLLSSGAEYVCVRRVNASMSGFHVDMFFFFFAARLSGRFTTRTRRR